MAFPPSVDWTRCNDELRNRVVGAIVVDGQVVLDRGVAGASATTARIALASPNAIEAGRSRGSFRCLYHSSSCFSWWKTVLLHAEQTA